MTKVLKLLILLRTNDSRKRRQSVILTEKNAKCLKITNESKGKIIDLTNNLYENVEPKGLQKEICDICKRKFDTSNDLMIHTSQDHLAETIKFAKENIL